MLRLLFPPVNGKGRAPGLSAKSGPRCPKLPVAKWAPTASALASSTPGPCHVAAGWARRVAGWGRRAGGHCRVGRGPGFGGRAAGAPSEPHRAGARAAGRPQQAPLGRGRAPRRRQTLRTHRAAVLLQRHQFAPDVDCLEAVEVLLPGRAGRSPQEQPRRRRRHHGLFLRWRRREGKDGAGGSGAGGGRRWLWRRSTRKAGRAPFWFSSAGDGCLALDLSFPVCPEAATPCPGPQSQGFRILSP